MRVAITGGSGFIGTNIAKALLSRGDEVLVVDKNPSRFQHERLRFVQADLMDSLDSGLLEGYQGVIHLAGKNIFGRWTAKSKQEICSSRIESTRNVVQALEALKEKPTVFLCVSATGFYGDRGEEELVEEDQPGNDFLSRVVVDWEKEAIRAEGIGIRTCMVRTAPVLGKGGFLEKMSPLLKAKFATILGNGNQWMPWIHMEDIVGTYLFLLDNQDVSGPVNAAAPDLKRNTEFTKILARVTNALITIPVPARVLKIALGEMGESILVSQKVLSSKLLNAGYSFAYPDLESALREIFSTQR